MNAPGPVAWLRCVAEGPGGRQVAKVTQTLLHDPARVDVPGNCLQAAVASLLALPLDAVPHFAVFADWQVALRLWADGRDLTLRSVVTDTVPDWPCIVSGPSVRGVPHAVVAVGGQVVWDPHPSRAGLVEVCGAWWFERQSQLSGEAPL